MHLNALKLTNNNITHIEMRKLLFTAFALFFSVGVICAQDLEQTTNTYNEAATLLNEGNNQAAIDKFKEALSYATALGEEGAELVTNCKDIIPKIYLAQAKDLLGEKKNDEAIAQLKAAISTANDYANNQDVVDEATQLIPQVMMSSAGSLLNAKKYNEAAALYQEICTIQPENGVAFLRLGMALNAGGQQDSAVEAFIKASELGQSANANKQLTNLFLKKSAAAQKSKDWKGVVENANKVLEYNENNPTAHKLLGIANLSLKDYAASVAGFEAYLALQPNAKDKVQITYQLASALEESGKTAEACGYYKSISQDPQWGEAARYKVTTLKCN